MEANSNPRDDPSGAAATFPSVAAAAAAATSRENTSGRKGGLNEQNEPEFNLRNEHAATYSNTNDEGELKTELELDERKPAARLDCLDDVDLSVDEDFRNHSEVEGGGEGTRTGLEEEKEDDSSALYASHKTDGSSYSEIHDGSSSQEKEGFSLVLHGPAASKAEGRSGSGDPFSSSVESRAQKAKANSYKMIEALKAYKRKHGDSKVPQSEGALGNWVRRVRSKKNEYDKTGHFSSSILDAEIMGELDDLGFGWKLTKNWEDHYKDLKAFKEKEGHCHYKTRQGPLGRWVTEQRKHYKRFQSDNPEEPSKAKITQEQIDKLDKIGFAWDMQN